MSEEIVFVVSAAIILAGALGVVLSKNPVHSALFLIQTLMGVALLFLIEEAHFLAAVQVVVYAGAIVILFLFVIMLLGVDKAEAMGVDPIGGQRELALVIGASIAAFTIVTVGWAVDGATGAGPSSQEHALDNGLTDIERIGRVLFTDYAFGFEITAAMLTIAVIGAVVLTRSISHDDVLDDLVPASMALPSLAPAGANDEDHGDHTEDKTSNEGGES
ncbi:MAG: NADH-quinone oxidoreductase subunit J [Acidimicrobiaceae bacterium]|jgi:NADH-quinone oxidoreductase subunit J|nr:NADH-quinone oxidoreductase subunit J [Acidimicrobiaceae bacterium]MBT5579371.1 NADH-quinone oxidoreductase subunit J [Acidimicrobiaceae bacterium]MBT5849768.1 NADH-quinone oxidoreductase subunit J [Acidimicrobiaceae bacterium]MDG1409624.1 NADH-quinone oxidoreductase subunit J [Acidimicrobiales bacterium]MDG2218517.1 NADH-quinone oxidoreductase subunit J [Acidimicrobiales bacterium]